MGRMLLVCRLAARDLTHRRTEAVLFLIVILAATTTLTLGLALSGVTSQPYRATRAATAGPDVVGVAFPSQKDSGTLADLTALARVKGVVAHTGPYPVAFSTMRAHGQTDGVVAEGRDEGRASIDQPKVTQGSWVRAGGVVVERTFADALDIQVGDRITLNGQPFPVVGIAVTAAIPSYPNVGFLNFGSKQYPNPGVIWLTRPDARSLATHAQPLLYVENLKLADQVSANAFANPYENSGIGPLVVSWQGISQQDSLLVSSDQKVLLIGSWLLGLLAVASVAVLVGGRMADQIRRVGLLKTVGATPKLVAAVLLAEYVILALLASAAGLVVGWLAAPLLTSPGAGLLGAAGAPTVGVSSAVIVVGMALAVAALATFVPALRAAQTSTIHALVDSASPPRRRAWLIALSARLPVPLLLGMRVAARRPRRIVLSTVSIAITVSGIVAVLIVHATSDQQSAGSAGLNSPTTDQLNKVMLIITVMLVALAAVNAIFITWATVLDARPSSALARALGATPQQVTAGMSAAQVLPALPGALLGIPGGFGLLASVSHGGTLTVPPLWWLLGVVLGTLVVVAGLTAIPARIGARRPVAEILQSETA